MIARRDTGAITSVNCEVNKFKLRLLQIHQRKQEELARSLSISRLNTMDPREIKAQAEMQKDAQSERAEAIEKHLHWLRNSEVRPWNERATWYPSDSTSDTEIEDINWGQNSPPPSSSKHGDLPILIFWDKIGFQVFKDALGAEDDTREGQNCTRTLSHLELDVQGLDAKGNVLRVQRTIKVKLQIRYQNLEQRNTKKTTMKLKRVLSISSPDASSLPSTRLKGRELYKGILEQLAQHEVNKALDERNHYLREVFQQEVDHVRECRESKIAAHEWTFQQPEICIQGPDGTMIGLKEKRTDSEKNGEVVLTHTVMIEQERGDKGRDHLFDLPVGGTESERRTRQARWSISSAIDRCVASGSAERFVLDGWVDGTFLPRD